MAPLYGPDLAYIHASAYAGLARQAAPAIVAILRSAAIPVRRVVDVGCGAGPLTHALLAEGFAVTAIESSPEFAALARAAAPAAEVICGSAYAVPLPSCEAIVALGEPLTYHSLQADAESLVAGFFRRSAEVLPAGGLLIFDIIEAGTPSLNSRSWAAGEDWALLAETTEDPAARTLTRHIQTFRRIQELYRRDEERHEVRVFDAAALTGQLQRLRFAVKTAQAYGDYRLLPRRRAFVCRRLSQG